MARAIVTFARGWQALSVTRSLGRQGIDVYCGEEAPFAPCFFSKYCRGSFIYPSVSREPEAFLDFLEAKVIELKPSGDEPYVLMPVHKETWLIAQHRERFEPYITVPLTTFENMANTHNKGKIAVLAQELGIAIPKTHLFSSIDEVYRRVPEINFPAFLKVREGASGVGIKKVNTPEELTTNFKAFVEGFELDPADYPIVQEFCIGEDHCVTALFDMGRPVATMTYRSVRAFPRETGASALRESVPFPEAEQATARMLEHMNWHGIAELDFRRGPNGEAYLIELNPRFFGGLPQAVASNVDYPHLLYRIACGEHVEAPEVDYSVRTETPVTALLATLDEIANDDEMLARFKGVRDQFRELGHTDVREVHTRLTPLWDAMRKAANPSDLKAFLSEKFEVHSGTMNDILQPDDMRPVLGVLYPLALMLKHGKLSMELLTSEADLEAEKPRLRLRDLLRRPRWRTLWLTAGLFALTAFLMNWEPTAGNVGTVLGWPHRLAEKLLGDVSSLDLGRAVDALKYTLYHALNLGFLYVCAALLLRESRTKHEDQD